MHFPRLRVGLPSFQATSFRSSATRETVLGYSRLSGNTWESKREILTQASRSVQQLATAMVVSIMEELEPHPIWSQIFIGLQVIAHRQPPSPDLQS